jgi:hypothetical protein
MLTLYTSVGLLKLNKESDYTYPSIFNNQREHSLDPPEMLIWSSLSFHFLTFPELKKHFEQQSEKLSLQVPYSFEHYARRLLFRGLIIKGEGLTYTDALYNLLGNLYIVPLNAAFHMKLFSGLRLMLKRQLNISQLKHSLFQKPKISPVEKLILNYTREAALSTAELLQYFDSNKTQNIKQYVSTLSSGKMTCDELKQHVHTEYIQHPLLFSISNLYMQKQILFRTL